MKPFRFSLAAVRILRTRQERESLERYAASLQRRTECLQALEAANNRLSLARHEWSRASHRGCSAYEMVQFQAWCRDLETKRDRQIADMKQASSNVTAAYETFLAARRAREMVDKNRDNQLRAHNQRAARAEQNELDDLARRDIPGALAPAFHTA